LTVEGDMMFVPINTLVTFIANGELQKFTTQVDTSIDIIEEAILDGYSSYREESLCIGGKNVMFPNIASGYMVIEGKIGDSLIKAKRETWLSLKETKKVMKYGLRKGDVLHLKGISSLKVTEVDYGNQMLCVTFE
jgi:hypothetical protein